MELLGPKSSCDKETQFSSAQGDAIASRNPNKESKAVRQNVPQQMSDERPHALECSAKHHASQTTPQDPDKQTPAPDRPQCESQY